MECHPKRPDRYVLRVHRDRPGEYLETTSRSQSRSSISDREAAVSTKVPHRLAQSNRLQRYLCYSCPAVPCHAVSLEDDLRFSGGGPQADFWRRARVLHPTGRLSGADQHVRATLQLNQGAQCWIEI